MRAPSLQPACPRGQARHPRAPAGLLAAAGPAGPPSGRCPRGHPYCNRFARGGRPTSSVRQRACPRGQARRPAVARVGTPYCNRFARAGRPASSARQRACPRGQARRPAVARAGRPRSAASRAGTPNRRHRNRFDHTGHRRARTCPDLPGIARTCPDLPGCVWMSGLKRRPGLHRLVWGHQIINLPVYGFRRFFSTRLMECTLGGSWRLVGRLGSLSWIP